MSQTFTFPGLSSRSCRVLLLGCALLLFPLSSPSLAKIFMQIPKIKGGSTEAGEFLDQHLVDYFSFVAYKSDPVDPRSETVYRFELGLQPHLSFPTIIMHLANGIVLNDLKVTSTSSANDREIAMELYEFKNTRFDEFYTFSTGSGGNSGAGLSLVPLDDFSITYFEYDPKTGKEIGNVKQVFAVDRNAQLSLLTSVPEPSSCLLAVLSLLGLGCQRRRS